MTGGYQPPPMFKYACFKSGIDIKDIEVIDAGSADAMVTAFRGVEAITFICRGRIRSCLSTTERRIS
ncbi:MAG: hypothetical protein WDN50_17585 [Bradyrhizobium sp.]